MQVARVVTGVGNGMNTATVPVWHSETTSAKSRGRALAIELAINIFGVVSSYCYTAASHSHPGFSADDGLLGGLRIQLRQV